MFLICLIEANWCPEPRVIAARPSRGWRRTRMGRRACWIAHAGGLCQSAADSRVFLQPVNAAEARLVRTVTTRARRVSAQPRLGEKPDGFGDREARGLRVTKARRALRNRRLGHACVAGRPLPWVPRV